jgi:hypothetical protein
MVIVLKGLGARKIQIIIRIKKMKKGQLYSQTLNSFREYILHFS